MGVSRISTEKSAGKAITALKYHLERPDSDQFVPAKRLDVMLQGSHIFAADVYYHLKCFGSFVYPSQKNV